MPPHSHRSQPGLDQASTIVELCERAADSQPDAIAVEHGPRRLTYRQIHEQVDRWARLLVERGVGPDCLVGVLLDRRAEAIVALLAVLKAGGAFLPLDPLAPRKRLEFMLRDAAPPHVITDERLLESTPIDALRRGAASALLVDGDDLRAMDRTHAATQTTFGRREPQLDDLAYAIFTSGSTGRPKAALLEHRGLALLAQTLAEPFGVAQGTRVLQFASLSFDAAVCEIFVALAAGATLCLADQPDLAPGPRLIATLAALGVEQAILPPSVLALCPAAELPDLGTLVVAGEACSSRVASQWSVGRRFVNAYGPTETTVCATWQLCPQGPQPAPPIGRPLPYFRAWALDEHGCPIASGEAGELCLAGPALARGYLNRPDLTAARFRALPRPDADPLAEPPAPPVRIYKTGDLVRYNERGELEFVARADRQIKLRGVRIEPREIQAVLEACPGVRAAHVECDETDGAQRQLVAWAVPDDPNHDPRALRNALAERARAGLPLAMLPARYCFVERLPLSTGGKVDSAALRQILATADSTSGSTVHETLTGVERDLIAIWESILPPSAPASGLGSPSRVIGADDDFFALGGDSLAAFELLNRIELCFGRRLQPKELIERPTVAQLAQLLSAAPEPLCAGRSVSACSRLVTLQPRGDQPPLFLVSPGGGNVFCYQALAAALGPGRPVIGLQARGVDGAEPLETVAAVAEDFVAAIREARPEGPYHLAGWSFGGVVAYEIARQLSAAGQRVATLALVEAGQSHCFSVLRARLPETEAPRFRLVDGDPQAMFARFVKHGPAWGVIPEGATDELTLRIYRVFRAHVRALLDYRAQRYSGPTLLILADDETYPARRDPRREWEPRCPRLEVRRTPGTHFSLLRPPHVAALAELLGAQMRSASAAGPPRPLWPNLLRSTSEDRLDAAIVASR